MTDIPADIAMKQAIFRQALGLSVLKQSAQADRAIAAVLEQAVQSVPAGGRGARVDVRA